MIFIITFLIPFANAIQLGGEYEYIYGDPLKIGCHLRVDKVAKKGYYCGRWRCGKNNPYLTRENVCEHNEHFVTPYKK